MTNPGERLTRAQRRLLMSMPTPPAGRWLRPGAEKAVARRLADRGLVALGTLRERTGERQGGSGYDQGLFAVLTPAGRAALDTPTESVSESEVRELREALRTILEVAAGGPGGPCFTIEGIARRALAPDPEGGTDG